MELDKSNTPPMTPSPPSATPTPSIETSEVPVEFHTVQASVPFKPLQMLMKTPLQVECGVNLSVRVTIHEEMLCCNSKLLAERFAQAKTLKEQYERTKSLSEKLAGYMFPEVTPHQFESVGLEAQAIPVIFRAYDQWPLLGYVNVVKKTIEEAVQEQMTAKNIQNTTLKDLARITDLPTRLSHLKSRGVQTIAEKTYILIRHITKKEEKRALDETLRAAAQHRLILPNVDEETVATLMQWIYRGTLQYQDFEQLYAVLQLAMTLGVEALTEICLTKLYDAAIESIRDAANSGITLQTLLGFGPESASHVLGIIFRHLIQDKHNPKRLQQLVIDALSAGLDTELWKEVKMLISHEMALQIIETMVYKNQEIKSEAYKDQVKTEASKDQVKTEAYNDQFKTEASKGEDKTEN